MTWLTLILIFYGQAGTFCDGINQRSRYVGLLWHCVNPTMLWEITRGCHKEDIMTWTHIPNYWPVSWESTGNRFMLSTPSQWYRKHWQIIFVVVFLDKLWDKRSSDRWNMPWNTPWKIIIVTLYKFWLLKTLNSYVSAIPNLAWNGGALDVKVTLTTIFHYNAYPYWIICCPIAQSKILFTKPRIHVF